MLALWYVSHFFYRSARVSDREVLQTIEEFYEKLKQIDNLKLLLKKYLTSELYEELRSKQTPLKSNLGHAIMVGCLFPESSDFGILASDPYVYNVFSQLFMPIIQEYHHYNQLFSQRHNPDIWDFSNFLDIDPCGEFIFETRVVCSRNLKGFPFVPIMSKRQFLQVEALIKDALGHLMCELGGSYHSLINLNPCIEKRLREDDAFFSNDKPTMKATGMYRFWPEGRAVFQNQAKNFAAFVSHEDHLFLISNQENSDLRSCYERLGSALAALSCLLEFEFNASLGYITVSPANLGTGLRAIVRIKLPKLGQKVELLEDICNTHHLVLQNQVGDIYDIFNKSTLTLGYLQDLQDGIKTLIEIEKTTCS